MPSALRAATILSTLAILLFVAGCSWIIEGSDQSINVSTVPSGADCTISRNGAKISAITDTPDNVVIGKSKDELKISCTHSGYLKSTEFVESSTAVWSAGNALMLVSGLIAAGFAVDSVTGAANKYPETVSIQLVPESFSDAAKRDAFFEKKVQEVEDRYEAAKLVVEDSCRRVPGDVCRSRTKNLNDGRAKRLAVIEEQRAQARIDPNQTHSGDASQSD